MKKIIDNLLVGTVEDLPFAEQMNYSILGCCKEPLHRKHARLQGAAEEGYLGKAMPSTEREYLYAEREHALYLNLIDARDMKYIPEKIIFKSLVFIGKEILDNRNIIVVDNKAQSRAPSIVFMWMMTQEYFKDIGIYEEAKKIFTDNYCHFYRPSVGFLKYTKKFFDEIRKNN